MKKKIKLLVYPDHRKENPYIELINSNLPKKEIVIRYLPYKIFGIITIANIIFPFAVVYYRLKGFRILHIHWLSYMESPINFYPINLLFELYFVLLILLIKLLGYKLIWTLHDLIRNSKRFIHANFVIKFLISHTDVCIAHNQSTLLQMEKLSYPTKNTVIIPHGSYNGVYKQDISRYSARKQLNISQKDFVFLFFGRLAKNKGLDRLLKSFVELNISNVKLIIAGRLEDKGLQETFIKYSAQSDILIHPKFIPNNQVQLYFKAADIFVYPAKKVSTSGSIILAFSFGLTVIAPNEGPMLDIPDDCLFIYNKSDNKGLLRAMLESYLNKEEVRKRSKNAFHYIKRTSWKNMAKETYKIYKA